MKAYSIGRKDGLTGKNMNNYDPHNGQAYRYHAYNMGWNKAFCEKVSGMTQDEYMEYLFGKKEKQLML